MQLREAYTGRMVEWDGEQAGLPLLPCLASTIVQLGDEAVAFSSRKFTRRGLGEDTVRMKLGTHAFVLLLRLIRDVGSFG